jgi:hypothetical protein
MCGPLDDSDCESSAVKRMNRTAKCGQKDDSDGESCVINRDDSDRESSAVKRRTIGVVGGDSREAGGAARLGEGVDAEAAAVGRSPALHHTLQRVITFSSLLFRIVCSALSHSLLCSVASYI